MKNLVFVVFFLTGSITLAKAGAGGHANWEARAQFGSLTTKPNGFNTQMEDFVVGNPDMEAPKTSGVDLLYRMDSKPLVFGLRYEIFDYKKTGNGRISGALVLADTKFTGYRVDVLAGWRFVDSAKGYAGVLGHVGATQELKYSISSTNTSSGAVHEDNFKGTPETGYGIALEGGLYIQQKFIFGVETGYTALVANKFKDDSGDEVLDDSANSIKMDLSGMYYKAYVGVTF